MFEASVQGGKRDKLSHVEMFDPLEIFKQLLDEIFVISRIIKVEVGNNQPKPKAEADNRHREVIWISQNRI